MKSLTKVFLLLNILILLIGCAAPKDCIKCELPATIIISPIIKFADDTPVLYNADIKVLKYHFSGLIAFRRMSDSSAIRIVFLTEVGLRMMEFSYENGIAINTYCLDAIKRNSTVRFMDSFIEMLLQQSKIRKTCNNNSLNKSSYFCKLKKGYAEVEYTDNIKDKSIVKEGRKNRIEARYSDNANLPDEINVTMKYQTVIHLKKLNNAFK